MESAIGMIADGPVHKGRCAMDGADAAAKSTARPIDATRETLISKFNYRCIRRARLFAAISGSRSVGAMGKKYIVL